jgi:hypothetical protein
MPSLIFQRQDHRPPVLLRLPPHWPGFLHPVRRASGDVARSLAVCEIHRLGPWTVTRTPRDVVFPDSKSDKL